MSEKGDNSLNYLQNLQNVNHVIYTLNTLCMPNIMTLAQAVLQIFEPNIIILAQMVLEIFYSQRSIGKEKKKYGSAYISWLFHISNFKILSLTVLDLCKNNGQAQSNMPPQLLRM